MLLSEIFLKEDVQLPEYLIAYLHEHCQPYLQAIGNDLSKIMYRGISKNRLSRLREVPGLQNCTVVSGHYDEREPKNSTQEEHDLANTAFTEAHGLPFRNGLFVTGSRHQAKQYGTAVAVFPIGDFKYCWSSGVKDMFMILPGPSENEKSQFVNRIKQTYQTTDLLKGIESGNEIMLYCEDCLLYVAI